MFISRQHAENMAASLRETADRNRERAAENTRNGDVLGAFICDGNARNADAYAMLADEAAGLLGDPGGRQ
jgi:hypothetical protein